MSSHKPIVLRCPRCFHSWFKPRKDGFTCKQCGNGFTEAEGTPKAAKNHAGSGQIAGRITVGRGMKWGAGPI